MDLDYHQIHDSLRALVPAGSVFELRLLSTRKGRIDSGYFDDLALAANALVSLEGYYVGVYFTPNPVTRDVLARSYNRITPWAPRTTDDLEITRRRWLLVDIDPKRPSGVSSTSEEHEAALRKGRIIAGYMSIVYGWCDPMINSSGNGCHLLYPMDEENTPEVRDEIHTFLKLLKALFDDHRVEVDVTAYNAARIWRLPGTWARKGDSLPERPHRKAEIIKRADPFNRVSISQVIKFNAANAHLMQRALNGASGTTSKTRNEYPADEALYKRLNDYALRNVKLWVPHFFPTAREYKEGYRVASADIGQTYEEDLTIHPKPMGIKYFGDHDQGSASEGRRTAISTIAEFALHSDKETAAKALSDVLKFPISEFDRLPIPQPIAPMGNSMQMLLGTKPRFDFKGIRTVADLQKKKFTETKWIIKGVIPVGNILLTARPKMRKTWLALQLARAIAAGYKFLDWQCEKGEVLFLGLEDNERRLQNRIRTLEKFEIFPPDLSGFRYWTGGMDYDGAGRLRVLDHEEAARTLAAFPRGEAGVDALEQYLEQYPETSTIIIDTLAHFRGERTSRDIYQSDYESMMPLTKLAARKGVLIMPVHHEKKGNADREKGGDFLEDVSGSAGITGGADGVLAIKGRRGVQEENESRKILLSGRDVPFDYEIDVAFDAERGGWLKAAREDTRVAIRSLLTRHPYMNQQDLKALLPNTSQSRLLRVLLEMKMDREITQDRNGYTLNRSN